MDIMLIYSDDGTLICGDDKIEFSPMLFCEDVYLYNNNIYLKDSYKKDNKIYINYKNITKLKPLIDRGLKDSLTNYYSKNYLYEFVEKKIQQKQDFVLIFGDIDNFKKINTDLGHFVADKMLKKLSEILINNININDIPFRFGGDEVFVVSDNTNLEQQFELYKNINKKFCEECDVTCSFGIIKYDKSKTIENNLSYLDSLLAESKQKGKNLIILGD